jgi:hypothetical protein
MSKPSRVLLIISMLLLAGVASAHPLPKNHFDRTIEIRVEPAGVQVRYVLSLSEETMQFDGLKCLAPDDIVKLRDDPRETFRKLYVIAKAEQMRRGFTVLLDSADVPLQLKKTDTGWQDQHLRFTFVFEGTWTLKPGPHEFQFYDETPYVGNDGASVSDDAEGTVTLTIRERNANQFSDFDAEEPTRLHGKLRDQLKPDEEAKRRTAKATMTMPGVVEHEPMAVPAANPFPWWLVGLVGVLLLGVVLVWRWRRSIHT